MPKFTLASAEYKPRIQNGTVLRNSEHSEESELEKKCPVMKIRGRRRTY